MSAVRWATTMLSGFMIGRGIGDATVWMMISGAIASLAPLGWSLLRHTWANTLLAATEVPGTLKVVNPDLAMGIPNPKVKMD